MCLQAALVEEAGRTPVFSTASKAFPISTWFLQKHEEFAAKAFFCTSHDGSCPSPPLQIVSPPPLQENLLLSLARLLAKMEAGVTLLLRAHWRASRDLHTDPVPVLRKLTGYTTFGFSAGSGPVSR